MKYKYFENEWEERIDWIENAKDLVPRVWKTNYKRDYHQDYLQVETQTPLAPPINTTQITLDSINLLAKLAILPNWKKKSAKD